MDFTILMQSGFNNVFFRLINYSLNKIVIKIKTNTLLSLLIVALDMLLKVLRNLRRKEAKLYIKFVANVVKEYYNSKHTLITIDIGE
jgi:hypothetical protein